MVKNKVYCPLCKEYVEVGVGCKQCIDADGNTTTEMKDAMECITGPDTLFPDVKNCTEPIAQYIFGDGYCKECARKLVELHAEMNTKKER